MKKISTTYLSKISLFATALLLSFAVSTMDVYAQGNSNKNKNNGNGNGNGNGACYPVVSASFSADGKTVTTNSSKDRLCSKNCIIKLNFCFIQFTKVYSKIYILLI
jgi:predicted DNA-binding helix-hairpin-helix protein